jgi:hypothetical protein
MTQCHYLQAFTQTHAVCNDAATIGVGFKATIPHEFDTFSLMLLQRMNELSFIF